MLPGETRNPGGRKKGTKNAKTIIQQLLNSKEQILDKNGNPIGKRVTVMTKITMALVDKAKNGDIAAYNALVDRLEGKPTQRIENTGEDGGPIQTQNLHRHEVVFKKMNGQQEPTPEHTTGNLIADNQDQTQQQ